MVLSSNQNLAPVQVLQTLLRHSIGDSISFPSLSDAHRLITPNLVAALPTDSSGKWPQVTHTPEAPEVSHLRALQDVA